MTVVSSYQVEIAWNRRVAGLFQIGISQIGGTDVIGADFGSGTYDDCTSEVKSVTYRRGRSADFAAMDMGSATIVLKDTVGKYNVDNSASVLAGQLEPLRPVRVRATYSGTTYTLFYGFVKSISHNPERNVKESVIEAVDLFRWLASSKAVIAEKVNYTVSQLLDEILTAAKWAGSSWRDLTAGGSVIPSFSTDGSQSLLAYVEDLLKIDLGYFFIAGNGKATYRPRSSRWGYSAAVATFDETMLNAARPGLTVNGIVNGQTVTRTGGVAQTYTDETSRNKYGAIDGSPITSSYFASDTGADGLAHMIVALGKDPPSPTRQVRLTNADATRLTHILTREIGDVVTIDESTGGTNLTGNIEALEGRISNAGKYHEVTYAVRKKRLQFFTIGVSLIGGTDVIGY